MATRAAESKLRHRFEIPVFILSVLLNAAIMIGAIFVAIRKPLWLKHHLRQERELDAIRTEAGGST
jgi:hypothetical protein